MLFRSRQRFDSMFRTLVLHTRYATIGKRTIENAHPVINGTCAAVHNGTIYNHGDVFRQLGLKRNASVDSEVIPAVVSWAGWDHATDALSLLDGGMATAIVTNQHPTELLLARLTGYPLNYLVNDDMIVWSSTRSAIETAWARTYGGAPVGRFIEMPPLRVHRVTADGITRENIDDRYEVARWDREVVTWQRQQAKTATRRRAAGTKKWSPESKPTGGRADGKAQDSTRALTGTTAKKRRKRSARRSASTNGSGATHVQGYPDPSERSRIAPDAPEDVYEDAIQDVMRWTGMSRIDAEDELLGYSPTRANEEADQLRWLRRDMDDGIDWADGWS